MKKQLLLLVALMSMFAFNMQAQRYLTPQFTGVTKTATAYGFNYTVLTLSTALGHTARQPLAVDIYQPTGDTASNRPVFIFIPTGNFLPKDVRMVATGAKDDSTAVEMCTRFAKLGYVAASISYREGWNPIATAQTDRIYTLINAAYRGIQDGRTAVRFFKANASTFKIDTTKIIVCGEGTGGYISMGMATLDKYSEILTTQYPQGKFTITAGGTTTPMVIEALNGDIEGKTLTRSPGAPAPYPAGDTLCIPNHVANTSGFALAINMGGALGDITWLDANSVPIISIAAPHDQNAPYRDGVLGVPIPGGGSLPITQAQGSHWVALKMDSLGITNKFKNLKATSDPYKSLVSARNTAYGFTQGGTYSSSLFPFIGRSIDDSGPYQWWNTDTTVQKWGNNAGSLATNPGMSKAKATVYIDSIMTFIIPRACVGLNLPCASLVSSTEELLDPATIKLTIAPNPALDMVSFESEVANPIKAVEIYDLSGRLMIQKLGVNNNMVQINRGTLPSGMYIAKVKFEAGILIQKIVFNQQ
jgi:hypothetical protein